MLYELLIILALIYLIYLLYEYFNIFNANEHMGNLTDIYNPNILNVNTLTITGNLSSWYFNALPSGMIMAWNGTNAPVGWVICDGTNNTPDLRGKFIYGWGNQQIGSTGGNSSVVMSENNMPAHSHTYVTFRTTNESGSTGSCLTPSGNQNCWTNGPTTIQTSDVGNNEPISIMPSYYTLTYVMKL